MEGFTLRVASPADIPVIEDLARASIRGLGSKHYDPDQINGAVRHLYGVDTTLVEDGSYFVVEHQGRIVASGGWSNRLTPFGGDRVGGVRDPGYRRPGQDPAVIRAFYVHPDWNRRGLGRFILDACEQAATQAGFDTFELTSTMMGREFYASCGYREVRPVDITLPDGQVLPHVLMTRP